MKQKSHNPEYTLEIHLTDKKSNYNNLLFSSNYTINPMGLAVVDSQSDAINLYQSDQPYAHLQEAKNMETTLDNYLTSTEGQNFMNYVSSRGKKMMNIKGVGAGDLGENTVAALLHDGIEGIILSNYDGKSFSERVSDFAGSYGLDPQSAEEYVLAHELSHAAGNLTEESAESFLEDYFTEMASQNKGEEKVRYESLAVVAGKRKEEAAKIENNYQNAA
tara:strand:+ start:498 stop:1154 length:657 start_codon:yes stop_codon:yes gene_type:complete